MRTRNNHVLFSGIIILMILASCVKHEIEPAPIPVWENKGPDSCTLNVQVNNLQGIFVPNAFVNLALSQDSLDKDLYVRTTFSDGVGVASFRWLYPRTIYGECTHPADKVLLYGSFTVTLPPASTRNVILTLH